MLGKRDSGSFSREKILSALARLNEHLRGREIIGELCLFGGTVMVLVFNARLSTRDVDAVFKPAAPMRDLAAQVANEEGLPENWLNDGVKGFQSDTPEFTDQALPQFSHLRLLRPSAEYLLAMKCLAARATDVDTGGDESDILFLARHLGLKTEEEITANLVRFFPPERILPKTQFMIHEVIAKLTSRE